MGICILLSRNPLKSGQGFNEKRRAAECEYGFSPEVVIPLNRVKVSTLIRALINLDLNNVVIPLNRVKVSTHEKIYQLRRWNKRVVIPLNRVKVSTPHNLGTIAGRLVVIPLNRVKVSTMAALISKGGTENVVIPLNRVKVSTLSEIGEAWTEAVVIPLNRVKVSTLPAERHIKIPA